MFVAAQCAYAAPDQTMADLLECPKFPYTCVLEDFCQNRNWRRDKYSHPGVNNLIKRIIDTKEEEQGL